MTVTIDKFGRILIPKSVRDILGVKSGYDLKLDIDNIRKTVLITPQPSKNYQVIQNGWGWPIISFSNKSEPATFSITDLIREAREERADQLLGQ